MSLLLHFFHKQEEMNHPLQKSFLPFFQKILYFLLTILIPHTKRQNSTYFSTISTTLSTK